MLCLSPPSSNCQSCLPFFVVLSRVILLEPGVEHVFTKAPVHTKEMSGTHNIASTVRCKAEGGLSTLHKGATRGRNGTLSPRGKIVPRREPPLVPLIKSDHGERPPLVRSRTRGKNDVGKVVSRKIRVKAFDVVAREYEEELRQVSFISALCHWLFAI